MYEDLIMTFSPEIAALISGIITLIFFSLKRYPFEIVSSLSIALLGVVLLFVLLSGESGDKTIFGLFIRDNFSTFFKLIFIVSLILTFILSVRAREIPESITPEYSLMLFLFFVSASFMVMARNFLALYVSMEILSLISYLCVSFDLNRIRSQEAGLKYAIFVAVASALMLFGISYLYGISGSLDYADISKSLLSLNQNNEPVFVLTLLIILMIFGGLFFKLAAFPFYAWSPDAYQGGPTPFVALLAVASKSAGVGALIRVIVTAFPLNVSENFGSIPIILGIVSILTMTLGNLLAINQNNLKRLLAYSSIAHAGYIIMALSSVDIIGIQSAMFYLVSYLIMNLGAFYCVQIVSDRTGDEDISNFYGMGSRNPYLAAIFTIFLLSLTGIPPFFGFAGKFYLFSAVISKGGAFYYSLAIIGVLNSAISLYYYARIIKAMYLTDGSEEVFSFDVVRRYVIGILGICAVLFGVYFAPVLRLVERFSNILNP